jgi:hypothetical protein
MSYPVTVLKMWSCRFSKVTISIPVLLVFAVGCQSTESYDSFRRESSTFQVADGPVYRYNIAGHSGDSASGKASNQQDFQLPSAGVVSMDLNRMDLSPNVQLPTTDLEMNSAHDHSGVNNELPQRDVRVNMNDRDVQYLLQQLGLYKGSLDGKRGPMTTAAIKKFQKSQGLTVDGVAGRKTKSALITALKQKMNQNF